MRDAQKQQVYRAEWAFTATIDTADQTGIRTIDLFGSVMELPVEWKFPDSISAVQQYSERALANIGWEGGVPTVQLAHRNQKKAHHVANTVVLPHRDVEPWAWRETVVLHELAHHVARDGEAHGPEFCAANIALVSANIGPEAGLLLRSLYDDMGAKVGVWSPKALINA